MTADILKITAKAILPAAVQVNKQKQRALSAGNSLDVKDSFSPSKRQAASGSISLFESMAGYVKKGAANLRDFIVKQTVEIKKDGRGKSVIKVNGKEVAQDTPEIEIRKEVNQLYVIKNSLESPTADVAGLSGRGREAWKRINYLVRKNPRDPKVAQITMEVYGVSQWIDKRCLKISENRPETRGAVALNQKSAKKIQVDTLVSIRNSGVTKANEKLEAAVLAVKQDLQNSVKALIAFIKKFIPDIGTSELDNCLISLSLIPSHAVIFTKNETNAKTGILDGADRGGFFSQNFDNKIFEAIVDNAIKTREKCYKMLKEALYGKSITAEVKKEIEEQLKKLDEVIALLKQASSMDPEQAKRFLSSIEAMLSSILGSLGSIVDSNNIKSAGIEKLMDGIQKLINDAKSAQDKLSIKTRIEQ